VAFCNPDTLEWSPQRSGTLFVKASVDKKIIIHLEDGKKLECTEDHPILTKEGFKTFASGWNFDTYTTKDFCATIDGYKQITNIQEVEIEPTVVYNLATENSLMIIDGFIIGSELNYSADPMKFEDITLNKK
jgi:hypothetical protein